MQNQRGFVGLPVLILIVLGLIVVGGGAYYVVQQQAPTQTASENFDTVQTLPTTNNQPQAQATTNPPAQTTPTQNAAPSNSISGTLTYVRSTNAIDPQTNKLGVSFQYTTKPFCDSRTTKDSFSIETGDGRTYPADCGGVVDHVYADAGEYRARYLRNGSEIASVQVKLTSKNIVTTTCVNGPVQTTEGLREGIPVITSISPVSGPKGTKVTLTGCNLSGFEGDHNVDLESESGGKIRIVGAGTYQLGRGERGTFIEFTIKEPCQKGETVYGAYSGIPSMCNFVELMPGKYKVSTTPWGEKSNDVYFTLTQ